MMNVITVLQVLASFVRPPPYFEPRGFLKNLYKTCRLLVLHLTVKPKRTFPSPALLM